MRFFLISLMVAGFAVAKPAPKPEVLKLKEGPVKAALKKNYRIHLVRNFVLEAEQELQRKLNRR